MTKDFAGADVRFGDVTNLESVKAVAFKDKVDVVVSCLASRTGGLQDSWDIDYGVRCRFCHGCGGCGACSAMSEVLVCETHVFVVCPCVCVRMCVGVVAVVGVGVGVMLQASKNCLDALREQDGTHYVLLSAICVQKPLLEFQKAKVCRIFGVGVMFTQIEDMDTIIRMSLGALAIPRRLHILSLALHGENALRAIAPRQWEPDSSLPPAAEARSRHSSSKRVHLFDRPSHRLLQIACWAGRHSQGGKPLRDVR